jgi:hypothetical protein
MWIVSLLFIVLLVQLYIIFTQSSTIADSAVPGIASIYQRALELDKKKALPSEIRESLLSIVNDNDDDFVLLALMDGNDFSNAALTELLALQP